MTEKKEGIVVVKGTKWRKKISKSGDSFCLIIPPYALAYLGIDVEAARKGHAPFVICKADYSEKHGAFIGFGLDEEHDKAQFAKAVAESRAQLGKEKASK